MRSLALSGLTLGGGPDRQSLLVTDERQRDVPVGDGQASTDQEGLPSIAVTLALCTPLAISATMVLFGFLFASLGDESWTLFAIGAFAGVGQWAMAERIWHRVAGMGSDELVSVLCVYLGASVLLVMVGVLLFPPLL